MSADRQNPNARKFPALEFRRATTEDVERLVFLFAVFFGTSHYPPYLSFDAELAKRYLTSAIGSGFAPHLVALHGDRIVAVISYHLDDTFSDPPLAVMDEVYALPEYAKTPVGRSLVKLMMELARGDGARVMHVPITSGHASQRSLINLFKKFGAEEIGVVLRVRL